MANGTMNVVLFGDETANVRAIFQRVHHYKESSALVGSFLEKAYTALHEEAMAVPKSMRETIPDSTSIFDLMERYYDIGTPNPAIEGALLCISQMASFMGSVHMCTLEPMNVSNADVPCLLPTALLKKGRMTLSTSKFAS